MTLYSQIGMTDTKANKAATTSLNEVPNTLVGMWYNELGSKMDIFSTSPAAGQFTGCYHTAVGEAVEKFPLVGMYDTTEETHMTLGW